MKFVSLLGVGLRLVLALIVRPRLWCTALGVVHSHSIARRMPGGVPLRLAGPYLRFRLETQYGNSGELTAIRVGDVLEYLEWVKDWNRRR